MDELINQLSNTNKVIGKKQTIRALQENNVRVVYIAKDADSNVTNEIIALCKEKEISVMFVDKMKELGNACGIDVNAATAAVLNK